MGQKMAGFQVGDEVEIFRRAKVFEMGWESEWNTHMTQNIGEIGKITKITSGNMGIRVEIEGKLSWYYPYFVLQKVDRMTRILIELNISMAFQRIA